MMLGDRDCVDGLVLGVKRCVRFCLSGCGCLRRSGTVSGGLRGCEGVCVGV